MAGGYAGKMLFVDLSSGKIEEEALDEGLARDFVGGYGLGAKIIYSRQKGGVAPLGPENILGFVTGPLTATRTPASARYAVVGKSPLTGTWGDASAGGFFGPELKRAGYDVLFFTGAAEKPVYLWIKDGRAELRDASHLWGRDSVDTEETLRSGLGDEGVQIACIGPAGEKLSLIACPINNKGRAPGRSGLGAVMGAKKLKAVAVRGNLDIPVADDDRLRELTKEAIASMEANMLIQGLSAYGTSMATAPSAFSGDSPVKNWTGVGNEDFKTAAQISDENVIKHQVKKYVCPGCPVACGGIMKVEPGPYTLAEGHKPEYETLAAFGTMTLNDNVESIIKLNDICNRYGLDTISAGCTIAFAIECYENGVITREDTDGLELTWGNHQAIVAMTEKLARREGFGDILADGVKVAAEKIGKGAEQYAMHIRGQEVPMHDPRFAPSLATTYVADATPGRHTQGGAGFTEMGMPPAGLDIPPLEKYAYSGKGEAHAKLSSVTHVVNASGLCLFVGGFGMPADAIAQFISAVTGWEYSLEDMLVTGERIACIRHAFNLREGLKPEDFKLPRKVLGDPPLKTGPLANVTVDVDTLVRGYFKAMDWDPETGKPSEARLRRLGKLDEVIQDLYL